MMRTKLYLCFFITSSSGGYINGRNSANLELLKLIRYAKASSNYSDFLKRHLHLRNRLLDQGYKKIRLIRSLKKFIFRYQYLETSSINLNVKLKALASWIFLSFTSFWRNSDSYEYKNKSAIHKAFSHRNYGSKFVVLGYNSTYFSNKIHKGKTCYSEEQVISMLEFLIDNIFVSNLLIFYKLLKKLRLIWV
jgi:hypothetical protein